MHSAVLAAVDDAAGHHVGTGGTGNDKRAAFQDAQFTGLGAGAFGENQHACAVFALLGQALQRDGIALAAVDGHRAHAAQKPADQRVFEQLLLGGDVQPPPAENLDQNKHGVQVGNVVGGNNVGAAVLHGLQILAADDLKPPQNVRQNPDDGQ